jgi:hypothetical protein
MGGGFRIGMILQDDGSFELITPDPATGNILDADLLPPLD